MKIAKTILSCIFWFLALSPAIVGASLWLNWYMVERRAESAVRELLTPVAPNARVRIIHGARNRMVLRVTGLSLSQARKVASHRNLQEIPDIQYDEASQNGSIARSVVRGCCTTDQVGEVPRRFVAFTRRKPFETDAFSRIEFFTMVYTPSTGATCVVFDLPSH